MRKLMRSRASFGAGIVAGIMGSLMAVAIAAGSFTPVETIVSLELANAQGDQIVCGVNPTTFVASSSGTAVNYAPGSGKKATLNLVLNGREVDE